MATHRHVSHGEEPLIYKLDEGSLYLQNVLHVDNIRSPQKLGRSPSEWRQD